MEDKNNRAELAAELRRQAEKACLKKAPSVPENPAALPPEELKAILQSLRVHQIELEMQNDELRRAQTELAAQRARYFDLYDLAPVGYCTVSEKGLILETNLTVATLLGVARGALVKRPISQFILNEDQDVYYLHRKQLFETGAPQTCELRLVKKDGTHFWARLDATAAQDAAGARLCRIVLSDITKRIHSEEEKAKRAAELAIANKELTFQNEEKGKRVTELKEVNEKLTGIYENVNESVFYIAVEADGKYRFKAVNPAFLKVTGLKAGQVVGKLVNEVIPESSLQLVLSHYRNAVDNREAVRWEEETSYPSGNKSGEVTIIPVFDGQGICTNLIGTVYDITERKHAEEEKEKRAAELAVANKELTFQNEEKEKRAAELAVANKELSFQNEEKEKRAAELSEAYEMERILNTLRQQSLTALPLQKKLADHLAILFSIPWLAVEPKGAVFFVNGQTLTLMIQQGLAPALLAACARVPFGKCLCGRAAGSGKAVASTGVGPDHEIVYEGMTPHGHYCAPITAAGTTLGVLNLYLEAGTELTVKQKDFIQSVTDIIAADILHARVVDQLLQSQKIEAVGLLAGGVAHDFNNILTAVIAYAEFIRRDLPPGDPKLSDVQEILTAANRAAALTRQLLAFGRKQIMAPQVVDLNKIVGGMTKMLGRLIGENIKLTTKLASAPCLALVDPNQLELVIMNLTINARDAMPKGGTITLETEILPPDEGTRPDLPRGPLVCLRVRDAGCGMTAEIKSRIFEPFFTTKEQGKGTGLGLPTTFGIIKQSGGEIVVESEPDKGTTFIIYLAFAEPTTQDKDKDKDKNKDKETPIKGHETVLFVEDEESLRRLGARILAAGGYTVLTAANGAEALKALELHGKPVDLLLTDVVMPGMTGRELALELARRKLALRTLYMSGYTDEAIVKQGVLEPGIAFIYKPFTIEALSLKLREVLNGPADQAKA